MSKTKSHTVVWAAIGLLGLPQPKDAMEKPKASGCCLDYAIQGKMKKKTRSACSTFDYPTGAMMVQTVPALLDIDIVTICPISFSIQEWFDVCIFCL